MAGDFPPSSMAILMDRPIFLLHGTPGSRLGPHPRSSVLHRLGVQLIAFDRPGYGESDRMAGRQVADVAADVLAIADAYGLDRFAVVGRSGGGPHALACAALLPERVTRAAVLVGLAPHGAAGLDWFDGMAESNVTEFTAAANGYEDIVAHTKAVAERGAGRSSQPARQSAGRSARPGPAGGGGPGHPVDAAGNVCRGAAQVGVWLGG